MKRTLIFLAVAGLISSTATANTATPRDVEDLVDIRASSGERELQDRGYELSNTIKGGNGNDRLDGGLRAIRAA